mgnify:FL=1
MIVDVCQRYVRRCARFVAASTPFDTRRYQVAAIPDDATARAFVLTHHYSGSYPAARFRFGLYERAELVGVAVFSVPVRAEVLRPLPLDAATELGRLVLLDQVPFNAETWFVSRCAAALAREGLAGFVMFSDPFPRTTAGGDAVFPGHLGVLYQGLGACFLGRAHADTIHLLPDGRVFSRRAVAKVRAAERGWRYSVEQLVAAGATPPADTSSAGLSTWVEGALAAVTRKVRHPGNLKYAFGVDRAARKALPASLPYPRVARPACVPFEGRATA